MSRKNVFYARTNEKANAILREAKEVADETMKNFRKFGKENISVRKWKESGTSSPKNFQNTGENFSTDEKAEDPA